MIQVFTVDGDRVNRCELFDEADLDAALVRLDELHSSATQLDNAAAIALQRFQECFSAHGWDAIAETRCGRFRHQ
jgi:hypothetical protein